jgi:organic hydroperoxide reductase OsmC/OhrA
MGEHLATIRWERNGERFIDNRYNRRHEWKFDGGATVTASASPGNVPLPLSDPAAVDPEEAFVAAVASCHMLWFLSIAAKRGVCIDSYSDDAVGLMAKNVDGKLAITRVTLRPRVAAAVSEETLQEIHELAHSECFIANSVKSEIVVLKSGS